MEIQKIEKPSKNNILSVLYRYFLISEIMFQRSSCLITKSQASIGSQFSLYIEFHLIWTHLIWLFPQGCYILRPLLPSHAPESGERPNIAGKEGKCMKSISNIQHQQQLYKEKAVHSIVLITVSEDNSIRLMKSVLSRCDKITNWKHNQP